MNASSGFIADLHVHSRFARACARDLSPEVLCRAAERKGVRVLSTGDFTHPDWRTELRSSLTETENGLFRLKGSSASVFFLLGTEIACVYKKNGKMRRLHHLLYCPGWSEAERLIAKLRMEGANLSSDGRPITGLDSRRLLEIAMETSPRVHLIPAHAWTPHFGLLGSQSGFDSVEECFEDLSPHIFALETGLSADPDMMRRLSRLDRFALISNSDAHSSENIAREANIFSGAASYDGIFEAVKSNDGKSFLGTIEFFPEEGKYHADGHRDCGEALWPKQARRQQGLCAQCGKPLTIGVLHRVEELADRERPKNAPPFERLVSLRKILGEILGVGANSRKVAQEYDALLDAFGPELFILRELPLSLLKEQGRATLAQALERMRVGRAKISPGYDGVYGRVSLLNDYEKRRLASSNRSKGPKPKARRHAASSLLRSAASCGQPRSAT